MTQPDQVDWRKVSALSAIGTVVFGVGPWLLGLAAKRTFDKQFNERNTYRWTDENRW
jgi:hypothetical protein